MRNTGYDTYTVTYMCDHVDTFFTLKLVNLVCLNLKKNNTIYSHPECLTYLRGDCGQLSSTFVS